jgi:biopolymer transport protein ExbD
LSHFKRESKVENNVPTSSMADIAFLLLIFFMVTTIFKLEDGLTVTLPRAETAAKQKRERIMRVWIDAAGNVSIQDKLVQVEQVLDIVITALSEKVSFTSDPETLAYKAQRGLR